MNADQARQVVLVRAVEGDNWPAAGPVSACSSIWSEADSQWADAEALRQLGEGSTAERFLIERSRLAAARLSDRDTTMAMLRRGGSGSGQSLAVGLLLALALIAGLATDALGPSHQVNLLAPPLLALMLWNLVVYGALLVHAGWRQFSKPSRHATPGWSDRMAALAMQKVSARRLQRGLQDDASAAAQRFASDWMLASRPIQAARLTGLLHLAALAVAAGALLALYSRGLVFEFKAGWDSTFLNADQVHRWLGLLLAPAQALSGQPLPDAAHIETLRFSNGNGENAARWIHWYAITTGLIMLPRAALVAAAMVHVRRLQHGFRLSLDTPYFVRLLQRHARAASKTEQFAAVLPFGHRRAGEFETGVLAAVDRELGPGLHLKIIANTPPGGEDGLAADWPSRTLGNAGVHWLLPLFALSATPEREIHGAFVRAVQQRAAAMAGRPQCRVMIDESGFRQRLAGADLLHRLAERRAAWQQLLDELEAGPALFADLGDRMSTSA